MRPAISFQGYAISLRAVCSNGFKVRGDISVNNSSIEDNGDTAPLLDHDAEMGNLDANYSAMNVDLVSGVIPRSRIHAFERILWRSLRGNLFMTQSEIEQPIEVSPGEFEEKNTFIIFAHGKDILNKIRKVAESLNASLYQADNDPTTRRDQLQEVNLRIEDLSAVLQNTSMTLHSELRFIADNLATWMTTIKKEKAIYQVMNLFNYDQGRKCLIAEGWVPSNRLDQVQNIMKDVASRSGSQMPSILNEIRTNREPPTYFRLNKFTEAFQSIIDAYGVASYREVNPGIVAVVTFPFLFSVMFGDLGHGFIMFMVALLMILNERKLANSGMELLDMAFFGRYIMLLMGAFSMFTGLIYNDLFSKAMTIFSPRWEWPEDQSGSLIVAQQTGVYPFGLDPSWHESDNSLLFTNSLKMKMSILLGVVHMTFSLALSAVNFRFFKKRLDIYTVFVPSLLFMECIFGYLALMIVYKWSIDWSQTDASPPGLLNMLIYMFLSPGTIEEPLYSGQAFVQVVLLLIALVCVPWLLLTKPLLLRREHYKAVAMGYTGVSSDDVHRVSADDTDTNSVIISEAVGSGQGGGHGEEFDFGEIMIHQVIHTIEFCLSCISHTASYLRLWALSLAHNQLSVVLWNMTLRNGLTVDGTMGVIMLVVLFAMWFVLTVSVLVMMEGTSAMLHSLRLHWVEAMSKHYEGAGYAFTPFSFKLILQEDEVE